MRILAALSLILLTFTSCEVNWGSTRYNVEWYVIAIPVIIAVILSLIISGYFILKRTYICPKCKKEFKPKKWYTFLWAFHFCGSRLFKCPHCKRISFCHPCFHKNKDDTESKPKLQ